MALGTPSFISRSTATNRMARPGAAMPAIGAGIKPTTLPALLPRGNWTTLEGPPSASIPPGGPAAPAPRPPARPAPVTPEGNPVPTTPGVPPYANPGSVQGGGSAASQAQSALQQALAFFQGLSGPQQAILQEQASRIMGQIGYLEAGANEQRGILNNQMGIDLASLGLNRQGNQVDRNAIVRELDLLAKSGALDSRSYNEAIQNLGLNEQDITRNLGSIDNLENLANLIHNQRLYGFGVDEREAAEAKAMGLRTTRSDATARGALPSSGQRSVEGEIGQQYQNLMDRTGIARNTAAFNRMEQQVGFENQRGQAGTDLARNKNAKDEAKIALDRAGINNRRTEGNLRDQNRRLELDAWQMGLDENTLRNNLQQGLSRLGIDTAMSVNQLLDNLSSNNLQARQVAEQIYTQALGFSGFFGNGGQASGIPGMPGGVTPPTGAPRPGSPGSTSPPTRSNVRLTGQMTNVGGHKFDSGLAPIAKAIADTGATITSGQRSVGHNASVGGVPNSQHIRGSAIDIRTRGMNADQRRRITEIARGFGLELIDEGDHLHVEMR